ncbi:MAG TPA: hypothetical protein VGK04_09515 [Thermoanaerobaculia bacterium]
MRLTIGTALAIAILLAGILHDAQAADQKIRGMNFAHSLTPQKGYGSPGSLQSLRELSRLGVDAIAIMPFGFQQSSSDTEILWVGHGGRGISETDDRMRAVTRQAHQLGMRVMLKPHIWLRPPDWPGSIDHDSESGWRAWFASYRAFILHYASLAEELKIESLSIGNELVIATKRPSDWRRIIAGVRRVYHGQLTYGANVDEVFDVLFWDALDFIGVSAYFPLTESRSPTIEAMVRGWKPITDRLADLSRRTHRNVVFTELGYRSSDYAAARPWEHHGGAMNLTLQADAFDAFFRAVWPQPWFGGLYIWKWESYPDHARADDTGFPIEHKPAEGVVRRYFTEHLKNEVRQSCTIPAVAASTMFDTIGQNRPLMQYVWRGSSVLVVSASSPNRVRTQR